MAASAALFSTTASSLIDRWVPKQHVGFQTPLTQGFLMLTSHISKGPNKNSEISIGCWKPCCVKYRTVFRTDHLSHKCPCCLASHISVSHPQDATIPVFVCYDVAFFGGYSFIWKVVPWLCFIWCFLLVGLKLYVSKKPHAFPRVSH